MSMGNIEHVVVLMLENRSFDSMLGWLYEHDEPALNIPSAGPDDRFRGLQSVPLRAFTNQADIPGHLSMWADPTRGAAGFTVPNADPGEEFSHVNTQFFEMPAPAPGDPITMMGFLQDFADILFQRSKGSIGDTELWDVGSTCLQSFTPGQLPVLSQLARHYAVSDAWYASVPSQTNPNRAFLMCGTSNGMVNNGELETNPEAHAIEKILGMAIGDDRVAAPTIFNALHESGIDWTVFWQTSYLPQKMYALLTMSSAILTLLQPFPIAKAAAALIGELNPYSAYLKELTSGDLGSCYTWRLFPEIKDKIPNAAQHFQKIEEFHRRARSGQLPAFSYIEPFWSISHSANDNPVYEELVSTLGNDYHPPSNLLVGEEFVKEVYTSLISNKDAWRKTALLITFDEFVGTFDHRKEELKPGAVTPPWGTKREPPFPVATGFKFDRLGARVPTILVSPYVQKGTVFRSETAVPYDHTSVIATTLKWAGHSGKLSGFGERASAAPTFEDVFTLGQPRTDETKLAFLDTPRVPGDPVAYGDAFLLKNQNGQYLSAFYATLKLGGGGSVIPASVMAICVDAQIAAYFPTIGEAESAVLAFVTPSPDPAPQISNNAQVMICSREPGLGAKNLLGAWKDSHDCYYSNEYLNGDRAKQQNWVIQKLASTDQPLRYGDQIYLVNVSYGQRLTRDTRLGASGWITTGSNGQGDSWTVEPAPARVQGTGPITAG